MKMLEFMGDHPILTFLVIATVCTMIHDIVIGVWGPR